MDVCLLVAIIAVSIESKHGHVLFSFRAPKARKEIYQSAQGPDESGTVGAFSGGRRYN